MTASLFQKLLAFVRYFLECFPSFSSKCRCQPRASHGLVFERESRDIPLDALLILLESRYVTIPRGNLFLIMILVIRHCASRRRWSQPGSATNAGSSIMLTTSIAYDSAQWFFE